MTQFDVCLCIVVITYIEVVVCMVCCYHPIVVGKAGTAGAEAAAAG